jgi:hypothetical protein
MGHILYLICCISLFCEFEGQISSNPYTASLERKYRPYSISSDRSDCYYKTARSKYIEKIQSSVKNTKVRDVIMIARLPKLFAGLAALGGVLLISSFTVSQMLDDVPSFRCEGATVAVGDRKHAVSKACGQPDKVRIWGGGAVEEWVYNFGPAQFIYYVKFIHGRLERIQAGEHGFEE